MLAPRWHKVIRDLWSYKLRTILVVMAIAVGVFAFGLLGTTQKILTRESRRNYLESNPASITMRISPFDDDLVCAVEGMREVAQAEGRTIYPVTMQVDQDEWIALELFAVHDYSDVDISRIFHESGALSPVRREVLLERSLFVAMPDYIPGDVIHIELPDGQERDLYVAGIVHDVEKLPTFYALKAYGYITLDTLEWLSGARYFNQLHIIVAQEEDNKGAVTEIGSLIQERIEHAGYTVHSTVVPEPGKHWAEDDFAGILVVMGAVGGFSLLLSAFLIINTISAMLKQQVRQIGMMKAVGARTSQVMGIYLITTMVLGLLSLIAAVPLGVLGGWAFSSFTARMVNFDIQHVGIEPEVVAIQVVLAVLFPPLVALIPILYGTHITTREALSDYGLSQAVSKQGLLDRLIDEVRGLPRPLLLSLRNAFRKKGRLTLTLTSLALAGAIFISIFSVRSGAVVEFKKLFSLFGYDLGITLSDPISTRQIEREAHRVKDVVGVEAWNVMETQFIRPDGTEGASLIIFAVPPDSSYIGRNLTAGRWLQENERNTIVIMENLLTEEPGITLGDEIRIKIGEHEDTWRIVGVVQQVKVGDETGFAYVSSESFTRATGMTGLANFVAIETEQDDANKQLDILRTVEERFKISGVGVSSSQSIGQFLANGEANLNIMVFSLLFMAILMAIVGGLGLTGTLSLSVIERTREIGVIRALGASNRAIWGIVVVEGMLIGLIGALLGAILAVPMGKLLGDAMWMAFLGKPMPYSYSWPGMGIWLLHSSILSAVASFIPARNAAKTSVREALTYE